MKKSLLLATVALALGYAITLIARLTGYTFNMLSVPAIVGGVFGCGLLLMAFSDYSRKPRFRVRAVRKATPQAAASATSSQVDAASAWTYTTLSA